MTTLYLPVLIESAQLPMEKFPEGTIATHPDHWPVERCSCSRWESDGPDRYDPDMVGWTALVPIELREQTHRLHGRKAEVPWGELIQITYPGAGETDESRDWQCTSYSTPWEEA